MKISVIVSTYNWPQALKFSIISLLNQTDDNYEIVVADDGSGIETKNLIEALKKKTEIKIIHAWQEDRGFRLAKSRNNAVKAATGEYLIFIDGDCIAPKEFIENHRKLAENRFVVAGSRILLSKEYSENILLGRDLLDYRLRRYINGDVNRFLPMINIPLGGLRRVFSKRNWSMLRGCNWSLHKEDYESVNGQDESFEGWVLEDSDMAIRLINSGVYIKSGRYAGIQVFHIWHNQKDRGEISNRLKILKNRIESATLFPIKGMY